MRSLSFSGKGPASTLAGGPRVNSERVAQPSALRGETHTFISCSRDIA